MRILNSYFSIVLLISMVVFLSSCDSNLTDSNNSLSKSKVPEQSNIDIGERATPEVIMNSETVGSAEVEISDTGNSNFSGSVSVTYENEKVRPIILQLGHRKT